MPELSQQRAASLWIWTTACVVAAVGFKAILLALNAFPFNADEAIVGLMARHMLQGSWPAFFYGQAYMGSLDASLVALGFAIFGPEVWVIRAVQVVLYVGTILSGVLLARQIFRSDKIAVTVALWLAFPTVNVTLYTTVSLGGYGEALLLGNLILYLALRSAEDRQAVWLPVAWGLLAGLAFWGFGLTLVFSVPAAGLLVANWYRQMPRRSAISHSLRMGFAFVLGSLPWWVEAMRQGFGPFVAELSGSAIAGASPANYLQAIGSHLRNLALLGTTVTIGLRPPWEVRWLAWPLLPVALVFWIAVMAFWVRSLRASQSAPQGRRLLTATGLMLLAGFVLTPFGADPSGRYFLPLTVPLALAASEFLDWLRQKVNPALPVIWLALVLAFNAWGTLEAALRNPPGMTTQFNAITQVDQSEIDSLVEFLEAEAELRGYTNYWVAYPLAFLSEEAIIYVPRLPYHSDLRYTERDDRYPPYGEAVARSARVAYITTHHSRLNQLLREAFAEDGATWKERQIGDFKVLYELEPAIRPGSVRGLYESQGSSP